MLVYWLDIVGTAVFAISGVLLAGKLRMDPFGVLVLGVVTAVGGGTIRDMALDHGPVFWVKDPTDLVVAMVTSMLTIVLVRQPRRLPKWMLPVLDAVGLAVFVGIGVNKAFNAEAGPLIAVCMGVITGVGGGIIRDVLGSRKPHDFTYRNLRNCLYYRTVLSRYGLLHFSVPLETASMMGMVVTLLIRLAAIRWHLKLPRRLRWMRMGVEEDVPDSLSGTWTTGVDTKGRTATAGAFAFGLWSRNENLPDLRYNQRNRRPDIAGSSDQPPGQRPVFRWSYRLRSPDHQR